MNKKKLKMKVFMGILCIVMISMIVIPAVAAANQYCYGWYHLQSDVTGVYSYVKETSAVHHQTGTSMQKWDAIAVTNGANNWTAEVNLDWYQTDTVSTLYFTGAMQKNGNWATDLTTTISTSYLDSNNIMICTGRNGSTSTVWLFRYSLDGGTTWNNIGSGSYDYGSVWWGDRYMTTFEDVVGGMTASSSPSLAGQTTSIQYQQSGWNWYSTNLDTVFNTGMDPHITYAHTATQETGTWHS